MIVIENDWLKVEISKNGAEVRKVEHKENKLSYMWTGNPDYWGRVSPILFPIVGKVKDNRFQHMGKTYEMSQHGFLRDVEFEVLEQHKTDISFRFQSRGRFLDVYPYDFEAIISYSLNQDSLSVNWKIVNTNKEEMFFSIGAHPAFRIPLFENETIEDYRLHIVPAANRNVVEYELKEGLIHEKGLANGISEIALSHTLFAHDALVYSNINQISLESVKSKHGIEVSFDEFPFVGIWSKYTDGKMAPFICIEPWYGIADTDQTTGSLNEKFGINKLESGETFQSEYQMKFR